MGEGTLSIFSAIQMTEENQNPTIVPAVNLGGNVTITTDVGCKLTFDGAISGSSGLTLNGDSTGTLVIEEACSYMGTTTINSGTYKGAGSSGLFSSSSAFVLAASSAAVVNLNGGNQTILSLAGGAGSSVLLNGGALTVGDSTSTTFAGSISDGTTTNGQLVKQGTGTLALTGTNTYSGTTTLNAGTLAISSGSSLGANTINLHGGTLSVTGNATLTQSGFVGEDTTIATAAGQTLNWTGTITVSLGDPFTLTLEGPGTNSLSSISSGETGGGTLTVVGEIGGTAGLTVTGDGVLNLSGANSYSGGTTVSSGTVQLLSGGSLPSGGAVVVDGILELSEGPSSQSIGNLSGTGTSIVINGVALTVNSTSNGAFAGVISGSGSLTKEGGATLSLGGTNSYSGGTVIQEGALALTSGGSLASGTNVTNEGTFDISAGDLNQTLGDLSGSGAVVLGAAELAFGTSTPNATISGPFSGTGMIYKQGSGTVLLSGTSTGSFSSIVANGTLSLTGQLPGAVSVFSGAILKGTGIVHGQLTLDLEGIVAPGNSVGTMTVASAILTPGSIFLVEIDPTASSLLNVLGTANLGEGMGSPNLQLTLDPGDYPHSNTYPILNAGSISGSFNSTILGAPAGFNFTLSQVGNSLELSYYLSSIPTTGLSGNQLKIVDYLNQYGTSSSVLLLYQLPEETLRGAVNRISPARNAFGAYVAAQTAFSLSELVNLHLDNARFAPARKGGPELLADASGEISFLMQRKTPCIPAKKKPCNPCCQVWLSGFGELSYNGASEQNPSFHFNSGAALLGFDYLGQDQNLAGGSFGFAHSHFYDAGNVGNGQINYFFLSVYGNGNIGDFYLSAALWGISSTTHNKRRISFPGFSATATADIPIWQLVPHLEAGYEIDLGALEIVPFAAADWAISWQKSYTESGAVPFNAHQKANRSSVIRAEAGLKFSEEWEFDWGSFLLKEKGSYVFEEPFQTGRVTAAFAGAPGSFTITAVDQTLNLGLLGLDFQFLVGPDRSLSIDFGYEGEFGAHYWSNEMTLAISKDY